LLRETEVRGAETIAEAYDSIYEEQSSVWKTRKNAGVHHIFPPAGSIPQQTLIGNRVRGGLSAGFQEEWGENLQLTSQSKRSAGESQIRGGFQPCPG